MPEPESPIEASGASGRKSDEKGVQLMKSVQLSVASKIALDKVSSFGYSLNSKQSNFLKGDSRKPIKTMYPDDGASRNRGGETPT